MIVVRSSTGGSRVASRREAGKLADLHLGDKVKILCAANVLAGLERYSVEKPAGEEVRLYGKLMYRGSELTYLEKV